VSDYDKGKIVLQNAVGRRIAVVYFKLNLQLKFYKITVMKV
jgi:hypothetical protein